MTKGWETENKTKKHHKSSPYICTIFEVFESFDSFVWGEDNNLRYSMSMIVFAPKYHSYLYIQNMH